MRILRGRLLLALTVFVAATTPAIAQVDLAGTWAAINHEDALERGAGPYAVDYTGIPLNEEGRAKALSSSASQLSMIERQCALYSQFYLMLGPFGLTVWNETDSVSGNTVAIVIGAWEDRAPMTIWMDGRPHPSAHTPLLRSGFTTGRWEGETLVTRTTHMKESYLRRNGVPSSPEAVMTMHFMRRGDLLSVVAHLEDPVYLSEPFVMSKVFRLDPVPGRPIGPPCQPAFEGIGAEGRVPHFLPNQNPSIGELTTLYGIPRNATLGGAATMYPEFRAIVRDSFIRPEKCARNCGGPRGGGPPGGAPGRAPPAGAPLPPGAPTTAR